MKLKYIIYKTIIVILLNIILLSNIAFAHSGRTDSNGGHYNRSTGEYHYHHGHPSHQHPNGICPYSKQNQNITYNNSSKSKEKINNDNNNYIIYRIILIILIIILIYYFIKKD